MTALYTSLDQITAAAFCDELWDYSASSHFDLLWDGVWRAAFPPFESSDSSEFFLVVNGELPDDKRPRDPVLLSVNFASHFGALSWAASHLIARSRQSSVHRCGIVIIDASPPSGGPAKLLRRMYRRSSSDIGGAIPNVIHLVDPRLEEIVGAIAEMRQRPPVVDRMQCQLLSALLHSTILTERADHHAIGNVMSSYILKNEAGDSFGMDSEGNQAVQEEAMPLQYQVTALCKCIWEHSVSPWRTKTKDARFGSDKITDDVLLIDDMADMWKPVLDQALPEADVAALLRDEFPEFIVKLPDRLENVRKECGRITIRSLTGSCASSDSTDFVLFLDLRLLPEDKDNPDSESPRLEFYMRLARIALALHSNNQVLPWLGSFDQRSAWIEWVERITEGKERHPEPLLAQVISLLDPTLPIIIFSSSHSCDFADPLAPFGNLSTGFRKPTPAIMPELRMPILKRDFAQTCERGARVKQIRQFLTHGFVEDFVYPPANCQHCEIFIDEAGSFGDETMNISGIAVYGNEEAVGAFHVDLHDRFLKTKSPGVTSFHQSTGGASSANRPGRYFAKRPTTREEWADHWGNVENLANEAQESSISTGVKLFAFTLEFPANWEASFGRLRLGNLAQEGQILDVGYTTRMVEVLEMLVFDVLSAGNRSPQNPLSIGIDLATRDAVADPKGLVGNPEGTEELRDRLKMQWGVCSEGDASRLQSARKSIDDRTPLRLLELALTGAIGHRMTKPNVEVSHARACVLTNWKPDNPITAWGKDEILPRPVHYLSDFLANAIRNQGQPDTDVFLKGKWLKDWFENGFRIRVGDASSDWIRILSDWDSGQRVAAIEQAISAGDALRENAPSYVKSNMIRWLKDPLTDTELRRLYSV